MQYFPRRQNKHSLFITLLLFLLAFLCIPVSRYAPAYPFLFQLVGFACAVSAILLVRKYLLQSYLYALTDPDRLDRRNDLTVLRILGNKRALAARIPLARVRALTPASVAEKTARQLSIPVVMRESYCVDLFPVNDWALLVEDNGKGVIVLLQCNEDFLAELKARLPSDLPFGDQPNSK